VTIAPASASATVIEQQASSRTIAYTYTTRSRATVQLIAARTVTLDDPEALTQLVTVGPGTHTSTLTLPSSGGWYAASRTTSGVPAPVSVIRHISVTPRAATAPAWHLNHDRVTLPAGSEVSISTRRTSTRVIATTGTTLDLPNGTWWVKARSKASTRRDASTWTTPRRVHVAKRPAARPDAPRHTSRNPDGQPRLAFTRNASTSYWTYQGNELLSHIPAEARTTRRPVIIAMPCGSQASVTITAATATSSSPSSPSARLAGAPCTLRKSLRAVDNLQVQDSSDTTITLTWTRSLASNTGQTIANYLLTRNGTPVGAIKPTQTRTTQRNLVPNGRYIWQLWTRDTQGDVSPAPASISTITQPPARATGDVRAFVLATDDQSIADARDHYMSLDWIYPTYYTYNRATPNAATSQLLGSNQEYVTRWFQARGVKVLPRILSSSLTQLEAAWASDQARQAWADQVTRLVLDNSFDGIQLDIEPSYPSAGLPQSSDATTPNARAKRFAAWLTDVSAKLATGLHAQNKLLSVAVPTNWCSNSRSNATWRFQYCSNTAHPSVTGRSRPTLYDIVSLATTSDEIWYMAWGQHWSTSEPGSSADNDWLAASVDYLADVLNQQRAAHPGSVTAQITLGRNLYSSIYTYSVVATDTATSPAPFPNAPLCPGTTTKARAVLGNTTLPQLSVQWVCPVGFAWQGEYTQAQQVSTTQAITSVTWRPLDGESAVDLAPSTSGQRQMWISDYRSVQATAELATQYKWRVGLWRLGREDQRMWNLPGLTPAGMVTTPASPTAPQTANTQQSTPTTSRTGTTVQTGRP